MREPNPRILLLALVVAVAAAFSGQWFGKASLIAEVTLIVIVVAGAFYRGRPSSQQSAHPSVVYHVEVVERLPTPQEVKDLTHVLEWDPDDYWALQETAGDGRWTGARGVSGDRASMERRLENEKRSFAGLLANFRAQQAPLPEGGPAWDRWERKIAHLSKADHRLVPDRRWRRHSLGVEAALLQIKDRLGMPSDKLRVRPLEDAERDELASSGAELDDPNVSQVGTAPDGRRWMLRKYPD